MNEAALKTILRCKLELAHTMIEFLPEALQEPIRSKEKELLSTFQEVVKEFVEETPMNSQTSNKDKRLKSIEIN